MKKFIIEIVDSNNNVWYKNYVGKKTYAYWIDNESNRFWAIAAEYDKRPYHFRFIFPEHAKVVEVAQ
jgi:hypothetical protein